MDILAINAFGIKRYCANIKSAHHLVSCPLGKFEVYVTNVSCLHKHLLSVIGLTANRLYHNHWRGHCVTIMTINEQTTALVCYYLTA